MNKTKNRKEMIEKVLQVIDKCLKYPLTRYERMVLLSIRQNFSAWIMRKLEGGSFGRYYRTKKLLKLFVVYMYLYLSYKEIIKKFVRKALASENLDYKFFMKVMSFPIRPSYWYDKHFKYKKTNTFKKVNRAIMCLERHIDELKNDEKKVCEFFLQLFKQVAFKGQLGKRRKKTILSNESQ